MIELTRFNKSRFFLNATLVESVEATPDTVITLISGKKLVVSDSVSDVLKKIETYYKVIGLIGIHVQNNVED